MFISPEIIPVLWFLPVVLFILIPLTVLCIWSVHQVFKRFVENILQVPQTAKGRHEESVSSDLQTEPVA